MIATLVAPARSVKALSPTNNHESRLSTLARWTLDNSPYRALSDLDCTVADGSIMLTGVVPSFYLKQLAQELMLRLNSGYRIENQVEVRNP